MLLVSDSCSVRRASARAVACVLLGACSVEVPGSAPSAGSLEAARSRAVTESGDPAAAITGHAQALPEAGLADDEHAAPEAENPEHETPVERSDCELDGRFALRVAFDVSWVGTEFIGIVPIVDPGRGELSFSVLAQLQTVPSGIQARFTTCASSVPEFVASISRERYQARLDDDVWDSPSMPTFSAELQTSCRAPGCAISAAPLFSLIGVDLSPDEGPWPSSASEGKWPDDDGDGNPGVAARMLGPDAGLYAYPPLDLLASRRARVLGLGMRVVLGMEGILDSCDAFRASTRAGRVETRAVVCESTSQPSPCSATELAFLNENLPVWSVSEGRIQARRLSAQADCKEARRAFTRAGSR